MLSPRDGEVFDGDGGGEGKGGEEGIRVCVRIRPLVEREREAGCDRIEWQFNDESIIDDSEIGRKAYTFDRVFGPSATNGDVYGVTAKPVVQRALQGYNGTVFAYGQTGSGKTYSMLGTSDEPGILPRAVQDVFDHIDRESAKAAGTNGTCEYLVRISYCEVYNEEINDLLQPLVKGKGHNLKIVRDDPIKGAIVEGLLEEIVVSKEQVMEVVARGESNRHYGTTSMNAGSSRSHTLFRMVIESRTGVADAPEESPAATPTDSSANSGEVDASKWQSIGGKKTESTIVTVSYLNLVDLAGSERQEAAATTGDRLREGGYINKSLSALALVISKLAEASKRERERGYSSTALIETQVEGEAQANIGHLGDGEDSQSAAGSMGESDSVTVMSDGSRFPRLGRSNSNKNLFEEKGGERAPSPASSSLARSPSFRLRSSSNLGADQLPGAKSLKRVQTVAKISLGSRRSASMAGIAFGQATSPVGSPPGPLLSPATPTRQASGEGGMMSPQEHIPYRNSKLTRLLRQSLGGNTYTAILCAMSPATMNKEESVSTLKFASQCKTIRNKVTVNRLVDDKTLLKQYRHRINELRQQIGDKTTQLQAAVTLLVATTGNDPAIVAEAASIAGIDPAVFQSVASPPASGLLSPTTPTAAGGRATELPPTVIQALNILRRMGRRTSSLGSMGDDEAPQLRTEENMNLADQQALPIEPETGRLMDGGVGEQRSGLPQMSEGDMFKFQPSSPPASGPPISTFGFKEEFSPSSQALSPRHERLAEALRVIDTERQRAEQLERTVQRLQGLIIGPVTHNVASPAGHSGESPGVGKGRAAARIARRRASVSVTNDAGIASLRATLLTSPVSQAGPNTSSEGGGRATPLASPLSDHIGSPGVPSPRTMLTSAAPHQHSSIHGVLPPTRQAGLQLSPEQARRMQQAIFSSQANEQETADELERKVISAVSAAAGGNADLRHVLEAVARASRAKGNKHAAEMEALRTALQNAQAQIASVNATVDEHREAAVQIAKELGLVRNSSAAQLGQIQTLTTLIAALRTQNQEAGSQIKELNEQNRSHARIASAQKDAAAARHEQLANELAALRTAHEAEIAHLRDRLAAALQDVEDVRVRLATAGTVDEAVIQLELVDFQKRFRAQSSALESQKSEIEQLRSKLENIKELDPQFAKLCAEQEKLATDMDRLEKERAELIELRNKCLAQEALFEPRLREIESKEALFTERQLSLDAHERSLEDRQRELAQWEERIAEMDQRLAARTESVDFREIEMEKRQAEWDSALVIQHQYFEVRRRRRRTEAEREVASQLQSIAAREEALSKHAAGLNEMANALEEREQAIAEREAAYQTSSQKMDGLVATLAEYERQLTASSDQSKWPAERSLLGDRIKELEYTVIDLQNQLSKHGAGRDPPSPRSPEFSISRTVTPLSSPTLSAKMSPILPAVIDVGVNTTSSRTSLPADHAPKDKTAASAAATPAADLDTERTNLQRLRVELEAERASLKLQAMALAHVQVMQKDLQRSYDDREKRPSTPRSERKSTSKSQSPAPSERGAASPAFTIKSMASLRDSARKIGAAGQLMAPTDRAELLSSAPVVRADSPYSSAEARNLKRRSVVEEEETPKPESKATPTERKEESIQRAESNAQAEAEHQPAIGSDQIDLAMLSAVSGRLRSTQVELRMTEEALKTEIQTAAMLRTEADTLRTALAQVTSHAQLFARIIEALKESGVLDGSNLSMLESSLRSVQMPGNGPADSKVAPVPHEAAFPSYSSQFNVRRSVQSPHTNKASVRPSELPGDDSALLRRLMGASLASEGKAAEMRGPHVQ